MKKIAICAAASAALAFSGAPAFAQTSAPQGLPPGSAPPTQSSSHPQLGADFLKAFDLRVLMGDPTAIATARGRVDMIANCLVRRASHRAGDLIGGVLAGDPGYKSMNTALSRRFALCGKDDPYIPVMLVSGAVAEQLLSADSKRSFEDRAMSVDVTGAEKFYGDLAGAASLDSVAGCLAVYSPGLVFKVLSTKAGGQDEGAALDALYKGTPECGVSAQPAGIPTIYQRAALATALYEWSRKQA